MIFKNKMVKKVLITGASRGIGKITAKTLTNEGYEVYLTSRSEINSKNFIKADLSNLNDAEALFEKIKEVDILINNAGQYIYSPVENISKEKITELFNVNFLSHYYLTSLVVPYMKKNKWGRIINISSISGVVGESYASLYSASKSAFFGFSKSLALELAEFNITINSISPGWVETDLTNNALSDEEKEETKEIIPQKRFVEPVEIANLVKYLISDEAKGITGQNINLCAGLTCGC